MADEFAGYATWYSWARTNVSDDAIVCHTATMAAMHALTADHDREAAAEAARATARDEAALAQTRAGYGPRHQYVEWFAWAQDNLRLPDSRCHEAARRALESLSAGGSVTSAADAATRVMLPPASSGEPPARSAEIPSTPSLMASAIPPPTTVRILAGQFAGDALLSILFGAASIAAPLLTPIYFPVLPILGFWRGVLALRGGRVAGGVVGLVACAAGGLISLLASGLLTR
jgi:hypothetical protein